MTILTCVNMTIPKGQTAGVINWKKCHNKASFLIDWQQGWNDGINVETPLCEQCKKSIETDKVKPILWEVTKVLK